MTELPVVHRSDSCGVQPCCKPVRVCPVLATGALTLAGWIVMAACSPFWGIHAFGQQSLDSGSAASTAALAPADADEIALLIDQQIQRLGDRNYRSRQMARALLESHPQLTLQQIQGCILHVESVIGIQLVELLSGLALHTDLSISSAATDTLNTLANQATSVGRTAINSLSAIADLQEEKAVEMLSYQGAYIGPQNFSINGTINQADTPLSLHIDEDFKGSDSDLHWIRYLKSIQVAYLNGSKISPVAIASISQLKSLRAIKLRGVTLTHEQLLEFRYLTRLEHLGLSYVKVDDSFLPVLMQLPISQSIRLYGTQVSLRGEQQLRAHFNGVEIFRGAGGFLGISSTQTSAVVEQVTPGSAAALAGIQPGDMILEVGGTKIKTFSELRKQLGNYEAGQSVELRVLRPPQGRFRVPGLQPQPDNVGSIELTLSALLQEESL
ncbi:MAG: PDZ domain-containing protein [Pirellulaceae bacterium]|nr:PDZ domain-containing protein [Pirellulaceae bacterium]